LAVTVAVINWQPLAAVNLINKPINDMKANRSNNRSLKQNSNRLAAYLATGIGAGLVATPAADAAIVLIDLTSNGWDLLGVNAGITGSPSSKWLPNFPISGAGNLFLVNYPNSKGVGGIYGGLTFAGGATYATPTNFALNQTIGSSFNWAGVHNYAMSFKTTGSGVDFESPDLDAGSYMGFQTAQGNYGWMEVTWAGATDTFQIYSAAYESVAGVAILAGDTGTSAVPEPKQVASSLLVLALGAAGVAIQRQRAKKKQAEAVAQS
jgi:hypothetical protein